MAEVALMFANQSKLFIPEIRRLGFLSPHKEGRTRSEIELEENSIKMVLRATMQALFGSFMDGLGAGIGALICGVIAETYSYIRLWQLFAMIAVASGVTHQLVELTRSRCSDTYRPPKGTKAYEIRQMSV